MRRDDFLYGAHSGLQKSVRRGDLDLAKTCFDAMWEIKEHKNWMQWRMPALVAEEAWYLAGELDNLRVEEEKEKAWRKMVYLLTLIPKNKDAGYMFPLSRLHKDEFEAASGGVPFDHPEMEFCRGADRGDVVLSANSFPDYIADLRKLSKYEKMASNYLISRARAGGMIGDRWMCLAGVGLIYNRGLKEKEVKDLCKKSAEEYAEKGKKPKTVPMPWYAFDMHTQVGKIASSIFMRKHAASFGIKDEAHFHLLWFNLVSAYIPPDLRRWVYKNPPKTLAITDSLWAPMEVNRRLMPHMQKENLKKKWAKMEVELKGIIEWLLKKREKES
jgi:hypothetical protein